MTAISEFVLTFSVEGSSFDPEETGVPLSMAVGRQLQAVTDRISMRAGDDPRDLQGGIMDSNGNTIGSYRLRRRRLRP
jgi:hypothetical protein